MICSWLRGRFGIALVESRDLVAGELEFAGSCDGLSRVRDAAAVVSNLEPDAPRSCTLSQGWVWPCAAANASRSAGKKVLFMVLHSSVCAPTFAIHWRAKSEKDEG